jgi:penicillin amidase
VLRLPSLRTALLVVATVVVLALLITTVTVVGMVRRPLPDYDGTVDIPGLTGEVTVLRDDRGVPQIYAEDAHDLFAAQGYVHAQDRFFEMDYRRHVTAGRLSELVGDNPDALAADMVTRTLGWRAVADQELPLLDASTRSYLQAYADGVNAYLRDRSPSELSVAYTVLGLTVDLGRIEPWKPVDSLAWLKAMAWDLRSNYDDEMGRALAYGALGDRALVEQLWPEYPYQKNLPIIPPEGTVPAAAAVGPASRADGARPAAAAGDGPAQPSDVQDSLDVLPAASAALGAAAKALDAVPDLLGSGDGIGSNSWVVSGEHTTTGKPLLANDPHLAPRMPSIWYQVGLHCTTVSAQCPFDVAGFSFSGLPGVVIGHNADIAWGFTNLAPDVTDFYLERVAGDNNTYLRDGEQVPLEQRVETIKVAGGDDVPITIRSTVHGPILSDVVSDVALIGSQTLVPQGSPIQGSGYEVSLQWTALQPGRTADAIFALNKATDWESFRAAASLFEVPAQNLVYADTHGHIGYQAPGKIPTRPAGTGAGQSDGTWPRLGWSSDWDWTGYIPFEELPSELDPAEGFIVTANQAVVGPSYGYRLTEDWDYGYRSQRIREVLAGKTSDGGKVSPQDMAALQNDTRNGFAPTLVPALLAAPLQASETLTPEQRDFTLEARDLLRSWDYTQPPDSAAAAYYNAVWSELLDATFADALPDAVRPDGGSRWFEVVGALLQDRESPWWDDQRTPTVVENRDQVIVQALVAARLDLTARLGKDPSRWEWGKLHSLQLRNSVFGGDGVPAPVRELFNPGQVRLGGGTSIVDATGWDASEPGFEVDWVPSMRMVVDLSHLDASTWVDLTGISGHPWSPHYGDQLEAWASGEQLPWPFSREAVEAAAEDSLTLRPQE